MSEEIPIELYRKTNNEFVKFVRYDDYKKLENIIKKVREHLQETINKWEDYEQFYEVVEEDKYILEILDDKESE